jgi:MerC mercury resistance protein
MAIIVIITEAIAMIYRRRTTALFALSVLSIGIDSTQGFVVSLMPQQQQQQQKQKQQSQRQRQSYSVTVLQSSPDEAAAASFFGNSLELQQILSESNPPVPMASSTKKDGRMIRYRGGFCEVIATPEPATEQTTLWQTTSRRLVSLANVASLLCVIDCTVLPVVTILLPLLGLAAPSQVVWLHEFGHSVAIYFVLPGMWTMS